MNWFYALLRNHALVNAIAAWVVAQVAKTIIYAGVNRKLEISRLFGDGGMPSGHSAAVTALAVTSAVDFGLSSFQFALTAVLALIVTHDAMGVRLETGKQAKILNQLMEFIDSMETGPSFEEKLKELIGHTPLQVVLGSALGFVVALILS